MASYFQGAHDMHISKLVINAPTHIHNGPGDSPLDHLYKKASHDAQYDSMARCDAPKCHPETRLAVQEEILSWIEDGDEDDKPTKIMWLSGPAGSGKTAIAGSVAESCDERDLLAATFFFSSFSSSETVRSKRYLVSTLVYQLTQLDGFEDYGTSVMSAIQRDPGIFDKQMKTQFSTLVVKPLRRLQKAGGLPTSPRVIIIDGLDEVEADGSRSLPLHDARQRNAADQVEILSILLQAAKETSLPCRIFVASRPERAIQDFFSSQAAGLSKELFLDDKYDPESDISLFLKAKFAEIRRQRRLPLSWPAEVDIEILVERSSGQFIYPSTVVRFVQSGKEPVHVLLERVLQLRSQGQGSPSHFLDFLYTHILTSNPDPTLTVQWIWAIDHPLAGMSAFFTRQVLEQFPGQAEYLLANLVSLVFIPPYEDHQYPYKLHHKSLVDFLRNPQRCGDELHNAFTKGLDYFGNLYVGILKRKSPSVPLLPTEWQDFWCNFFQRPRFNLHRVCRDGPQFGDGLVACDVVWWVDTVVANCDSGDALSVISSRFDEIHLRCTGWPMFDQCNASCTHWRNGILQGCRALGWEVPNAVAFLRDMLSLSPGLNTDGEYAETVDFRYYLTPPKQQDSATNSRALALQPSTAGPDTSYESSLALAKEMYARLPSGWESQFRQEVQEGRSIYSALRSIIQGIRGALRADVADVEVD